ncbi:hypothetical protein BDR07DRAFT_1490988 [Suillus spraguei]|nr:hypothetical protein BDR07DRAFT_1490988 [Suillus spraguei]
MISGDYCELFYFTNSGLEEAALLSFSADSDTLIMMTSTDGSHKWIPAGATHDPKAQVLKDENLTWEHFNEAVPCMIATMNENDWPADRVDMHIAFWSTLQNHCWRHTFDAHKQCALLLYQAQQRRRWHLSAGSCNSWSLARINQSLLDKAHEEVFKQFRIQQLAAAIQPHATVSSLPSTARPQSHHATSGQKRSPSPPSADQAKGPNPPGLAPTLDHFPALPTLGMGSTKPYLSASTKHSGPGLGSYSALPGRERKAVTAPSTMLATSAQAVEPSPMEPRAALKLRRFRPLTPYKAEAWAKEQQAAGPPTMLRQDPHWS